MLWNAWARFNTLIVICLGKSLFRCFVIFISLINSTAFLPLLICKKFRSGTNRTICSISPLLILDMFFMQNYADISTKNNNRWLFSECNHRAFRDIHEKTYRFRQASKAGLLNYFKQRSSYKSKKLLRSSHFHEILQMYHFFDFSSQSMKWEYTTVMHIRPTCIYKIE